MNRRALILGLFATPAFAGPVRNPGDITVYNLTPEDRRALVFFAAKGAVSRDELFLTPDDMTESTSVLVGGRFLHENGTPSKAGWLWLAGMEVEG